MYHDLKLVFMQRHIVLLGPLDDIVQVFLELTRVSVTKDVL